MLAGLSTVLSVAFVCLIGLSAWLGSGLPPTPSFLARNPCSLPCVYGLTPGKTGREEAVAIVEQISSEDPAYSPVNRARLYFSTQDAELSVLGLVTFTLPDASTVRMMGFSSAEDDADLGTLGDLIVVGLQPSRIYRSCEATLTRILITFGDAQHVIAESALPDRLRPDTPLTFMRVYLDDGDTLAEALISFGCAVEMDWHGFAPRWVYLSVVP